MEKSEFPRSTDAWGHFRLSVIGQLLASPPEAGELNKRIEELAQKEWIHPITGKPHRLVFSTIEKWYYKAKKNVKDPVGSLKRKLRTDIGIFRALSTMLKEEIKKLHKAHPGWSHQLHHDNLVVIGKEKSLEVPKYATIRRFRNANGFIRVRVPKNADRKNAIMAAEAFESREQRSFESTHVMALVHSDFHHCSRKLINENGEWVKPVLVAVLDDRSRLVLHAQWYWRETAENFVHTLCQAFLKRGIPRALMTDNGGPMTASETTQGLKRLSVIHHTTLPYTPQQNGKQECFWGQIEGRLLPMLEGEENLTLKLLNDSTIAWIELEYHRKIHSEIGSTPLNRFFNDPNVGRPSLLPEELRKAFTIETNRILRRTDCTISIDSRRYEIPGSYKHLKRIFIRYAEWDLSNVFMVNQQSGEIITQIFPLDLERNSDGKRRAIQPLNESFKFPDRSVGIAPLLKQYISDYTVSGLPMSYIPKTEKENNNAKT
ncbi:MAG: DDE-type integrase/transposase/recombinase [Oligoflexales bacterium]|nr:DDE-type integrase/transposase/recombinase [Oligoflexales bacterium]